MLHVHDLNEPPASALARGPAKKDDIEHAREDLGRAELSFARRLHDQAHRHEAHAEIELLELDDVVVSRAGAT